MNSFITEKTIDALSEKVRTVNPTERADYIQDGLIYCGKCKTQKESVISTIWGEKKVSCICKCRNEEILAMERIASERKQFEFISRLRTTCIADKTSRNFTFAADSGKNAVNMAKIKRYADKWDEMRKQNIGLLLYGPVGTGKSYAAACVVNYLIDRGIPALMTDFAKLNNALSGFHIEDKNAFIADLDNYELLVIDDLGAERQTEYAQEIIFNIVNSRYKSGKPVIFTTNLSLSELKGTTEMNKKRIYDRVLEMTVPILFDGDSMRVSAHESKKAAAKKLLEG